MDTAETLRVIKRDFRRGMNGIVSASMRDKGFGYKINFGLTLPVLHSVAAKYDKNAELAEKLWGEDIRESKMLAPMLYPAAEMDIDTARRWVGAIPYNEISDICCMTLFCKLPFAYDLAMESIESEDDSRRYLGITLLMRLIIGGTEFSGETKDYLVKIAKSFSAEDNPAIAIASNNLLSKIE